MNQSIAWRSPAAGVIVPKGTVTVKFQLPIQPDREFPLVLTATGRGTIIVKQTEAHFVVLENPTDKTVPYLMVIVPQIYLTAVTTNWKQLFKAAWQKFGAK